MMFLKILPIDKIFPSFSIYSTIKLVFLVLSFHPSGLFF